MLPDGSTLDVGGERVLTTVFTTQTGKIAMSGTHSELVDSFVFSRDSTFGEALIIISPNWLLKNVLTLVYITKIGSWTLL
jgi:hypothetical protein